MRHTGDCGRLYPRGCRSNCNCWCHSDEEIVWITKDTFIYKKKQRGKK